MGALPTAPVLAAVHASVCSCTRGSSSGKLEPNLTGCPAPPPPFPDGVLGTQRAP